MSDDKLADAVTWAITHAQKAPSPEQLGESVAREIRAAIDERLASAFGPFGVWRQAAKDWERSPTRIGGINPCRGWDTRAEAQAWLDDQPELQAAVVRELPAHAPVHILPRQPDEKLREVLGRGEQCPKYWGRHEVRCVLDKEHLELATTCVFGDPRGAQFVDYRAYQSLSGHRHDAEQQVKQLREMVAAGDRVIERLSNDKAALERRIAELGQCTPAATLAAPAGVYFHLVRADNGLAYAFDLEAPSVERMSEPREPVSGAPLQRRR